MLVRHCSQLNFKVICWLFRNGKQVCVFVFTGKVESRRKGCIELYSNTSNIGEILCKQATNAIEVTEELDK